MMSEDNLEDPSSTKMLESIKQSFDFKIDTLSRQLEGLNDEMATLKTNVEHGAKMRSLEWAIDNVSKYGGFKYRHAKVEPNTIYVSPEFVRSVLIWFRKGQGTFIDDHIYISDRRWEYPSEVEKEAFRNTLSEQVFQLTGQAPRMVKKDNGRYAIHYS